MRWRTLAERRRGGQAPKWRVGRPGVREYWIGGAVALAVIIALLARPHGSAPGTPFPFPCLAQETLELHVHPYLRIMMQGQPLRIPAAIGIRDPQIQQSVAVGGSCFEPLHTHDASGIIYIEGPNPSKQYTLGDFFAVWRATYGTVRIGSGSFPVTYAVGELLGHRPDGGHTIRLIVDGRPVASGPGLVLNALDYCSAESIGPPCYPTAVGIRFRRRSCGSTAQGTRLCSNTSDPAAAGLVLPGPCSVPGTSLLCTYRSDSALLLL